MCQFLGQYSQSCLLPLFTYYHFKYNFKIYDRDFHYLKLLHVSLQDHFFPLIVLHINVSLCANLLLIQQIIFDIMLFIISSASLKIFHLHMSHPMYFK